MKSRKNIFPHGSWGLYSKNHGKVFKDINDKTLGLKTVVYNLVSKDQTIGGIIFAICLIIGVLYTVGLFYLGGNPFEWKLSFTLIAIPVFIAFIAVMAIGAWIGWTMATTPPPKPIEGITSELEEEKKEEAAEVKEAEKTEAATEPKEEEKKPEKKTKKEK